MRKKEGNVLKFKAIVIFAKGEVFILHGYDSVEMTCILVDWAENPDHPVTWEQAIEAVYEVKRKQIAIVKESCNV